MELEFIKGKGPIFHDPIKTQEDLDSLRGGREASCRLTYVYETIKTSKRGVR